MTRKVEMPEAGSVLDRPCRNSHHGVRMGFGFQYSPEEFDPGCGTCTTRVTLAFHDHLHLNPDDADACVTPGISGKPGIGVECRCGGFHH